MDTSDLPPGTQGTLRLLRGLVIALAGVMILGVVALIGLMWVRLPDGNVPMPAQIVLPDGTVPVAFTRGPDWIAVATEDAILIHDLSGTLRQTVPIERE